MKKNRRANLLLLSYYAAPTLASLSVGAFFGEERMTSSLSFLVDTSWYSFFKNTGVNQSQYLTSILFCIASTPLFFLYMKENTSQVKASNTHSEFWIALVAVVALIGGLLISINPPSMERLHANDRGAALLSLLLSNQVAFSFFYSTVIAINCLCVYVLFKVVRSMFFNKN